MTTMDRLFENEEPVIYTQGGYKLGFFKGGMAQFVTVGIVDSAGIAICPFLAARLNLTEQTGQIDKCLQSAVHRVCITIIIHV